MATVAYQGRGSKLRVDNLIASPVTHTTIAQLQKFGYSGLKAAEEKVTNLDSPDAFEELIMTIVDPGDISFDGILDPENASVTDLATRLQNRTLTNFSVLLTDGTVHTFAGYVSEFTPVTVDYSKALVFSGKIRITGAVTIVPF